MKMPIVTMRLAVMIVIASTTLGGESAKRGEKYDLTGRWSWVGTSESAIPPFLVEMIGLIPEGEMTFVTCEENGEMELVQKGGSFQGMATQELSCFTDGGQGPFWPPAFPPTFEVSNGVLSEKHTTFDFGTCDFTAKVVGGGDKLMGKGECPIPLPPPYFLNLTKWKAQR